MLGKVERRRGGEKLMQNRTKETKRSWWWQDALPSSSFSHFHLKIIVSHLLKENWEKIRKFGRMWSGYGADWAPRAVALISQYLGENHRSCQVSFSSSSSSCSSCSSCFFSNSSLSWSSLSSPVHCTACCSWSAAAAASDGRPPLPTRSSKEHHCHCHQTPDPPNSPKQQQVVTTLQHTSYLAQTPRTMSVEKILCHVEKF